MAADVAKSLLLNRRRVTHIMAVPPPNRNPNLSRTLTVTYSVTRISATI